MPPSDFPRWLRQARELLAELHGQAAAAGPVRVTVTNDQGQRVTLAVPPELPAALPALAPLEKAILGAATRLPQTAKRLAAELGRSCNSHFRDALRSLGRRVPPLLVRTPDGYRMPD
jgi:hypothetical protein